jgi:hypothetical protein
MALPIPGNPTNKPTPINARTNGKEFTDSMC